MYSKVVEEDNVFISNNAISLNAQDQNLDVQSF